MLSGSAWSLTLLLALGSLWYSVQHFSEAYPSVSINIEMDRAAALVRAYKMAGEHSWPPYGNTTAPFAHETRGAQSHAATFRSDDAVQQFIELEEGLDTWKTLVSPSKGLTSNAYHPYHWTVRQFREFDAAETWVQFSPAGDPYGFHVVLPEDLALSELAADAAQAMAEARAAASPWGVNLSHFTLVESDRETQPGGNRVDHSFTYERLGARLGLQQEGSFRLTLLVKGDMFAGLSHSVKVPESFWRRYTEMRSWNSALAFAGVLSMLGIVVFGYAPGLFVLLRDRWVLWRGPLLFGGFVGALQGIDHLNQWTLLWLSYNTAEPFNAHAVSILFTAVARAISSAVWFTLCYMAGESLTRLAFPDHPQLWSLLSPLQSVAKQDCAIKRSRDGDERNPLDAIAVAALPLPANSYMAASNAIIGRLSFGLLCVPIFFAYDIGLYLVMQQRLGWWIPSSIHDHPDVHASFLPWLSSISLSLQAGTWEECCFRAVPLSIAVILGKRWKCPRFSLCCAVLFQAIVFGAGHANYPCQPFYARLVELIIPSFGFAWVYLRYGLLVSCYAHFVFDVVWFALPLFSSFSSNAGTNQMMVVACALSPLLACLWTRWRSGAPSPAAIAGSSDAYNGQWKRRLDESSPEEPAKSPTSVKQLSPRALLWIGVSGIALCIVVAMVFPADAAINFSPTISVSRAEAVNASRHALSAALGSDHVVNAEDGWVDLAGLSAIAPSKKHSYVWREGGEAVYASAVRHGHLPPPMWHVRFARFGEDVDLLERAEEYVVLVDGMGRPVRWRHALPEGRSGSALSQEQARGVVDDFMAGRLAGGPLWDMAQTPPSVFPKSDTAKPADGVAWSLVSAEAQRLANRTDWLFTFKAAQVPSAEGEARAAVAIAGDEIVDHYKYIHVPEQYERKEQSRVALLSQLESARLFIIVLCGLAAVLNSVAQWSLRGRMHVRAFLALIGVFAVVRGLTLLNGLEGDLRHFSTSQPFSHQLLMSTGRHLMRLVRLPLIAAWGGNLVFRLSETRAGRVAHNQQNLGDRLGTVLGAISAGASFEALQSLCNRQADRFLGIADAYSNPSWGETLGLFDSVTYPGLAAVFLGCESLLASWMVMMALSYLLDAVSDRGRRRWVSLATCLCIGGLMPSGEHATEALLAWLVSAGVTGLTLYCMNELILRRDKRVVVLVATGSLVQNMIAHVIQGETYTGASSHQLISAAVLCVVGYACYVALAGLKCPLAATSEPPSPQPSISEDGHDSNRGTVVPSSASPTKGGGLRRSARISHRLSRT